MRPHLLASVLLVATGAWSPAKAQRGTSYALTHVNVIPMDREVVLHDMTVVVVDGRIASIGRSGDVGAPRGAQVIEATGRYLLPGLMDMHVHMESDDAAPRYLAAGVTRVRNMSGDGDHYGRRHRLASGTIAGPVMYTAGPALLDTHPEYPFFVDTPEAARIQVRRARENGADWIKTMRLDSSVFAAVLDEAAKAGLPVGGHLPSLNVPLLDVYRSGFRSHEHVIEIFTSAAGFNLEPDESRLASLARQVREAGIAISTIITRELNWDRMRRERAASLTPARLAELQRLTGDSGIVQARAFIDGLATEDPATTARTQTIYGNFPFIRKLVKALSDSGVPLVVGTDSHFYFSLAGTSLHDELDVLRDAGLSPFEALRAATVNGALLLGRSDSLGTIAVGKVADLVLVDENPLEGLATVRHPAGVMVRGRWYDRAALDRMR